MRRADCASSRWVTSPCVSCRSRSKCCVVWCGLWPPWNSTVRCLIALCGSACSFLEHYLQAPAPRSLRDSAVTKSSDGSHVSGAYFGSVLVRSLPHLSTMRRMGTVCTVVTALHAAAAGSDTPAGDGLEVPLPSDTSAQDASTALPSSQPTKPVRLLVEHAQGCGPCCNPCHHTCSLAGRRARCHSRGVARVP